MPLTREIAARLAAAGELVILQRGVEIAPDQMRGPIRLRLRFEENGEREMMAAGSTFWAPRPPERSLAYY